MKKWSLIIAAAVVAALIWKSWSLYHGIETEHQRELTEAAETARQSHNLKQVLDVSYYHGTKAYHVVKAVNQNGKKIYIWIPEKKGKTFIKKVSQGWNKSKVRQFAKNQLNPKKLLDIRLGVESKIPVWEVTFIDQKDRYTFYYLRFDGQDWVKNIHL
ncbi:MAG TPA: DUF5590 domain-containing protein [Bacillales bacterium]